MGCGTGRITAHLSRLDVDACGIDLSPGMIEVARRDHTDLRFEPGFLTYLDLDDGSDGRPGRLVLADPPPRTTRSVRPSPTSGECVR
ncbi:class I SAM-dependent methyltransferase [Streptomyces sp. NPDC029080]|uniref:class I SAM-dependent methyltransferase n=1 Tax=Streptomyces sp. NPDC029080 TaxID=3155017 RepID=UPI0033ECCF4B